MLQLYVCFKEMIRKYLVEDQRGVTAIEYGLIAAVIVVALTAAGGGLTQVSEALNDIFVFIAGELTPPGG
ncbi:MAG: hypothetical protein ETSY2_36015 [Candidatus Entotheonella gemina]|uniref:Flp family type IVb pilin n=1 Tax=Candidatus Entotheonella gemina TaxID=1429439 RepID=W4LXT2_9BACT|nr:MAG: hypothetical protein ETSY2_36015 [Candidatus Entotheonella gemina]